MNSWQEFQTSEPVLLEIERRFDRLQNFERRYAPDQEAVHGFSVADIATAREAMLESIRSEAEAIPGKVYYWLYPFYSGNFLRLVAALGMCGAMDRQKDDEESRQAFYRFFKTVPMDERMQLGERLNHPELTEQAKKIQKKLTAKRKAVKNFMDLNHGN
ncbi:MAG: hypothetical protein AAF206_00795 [Bacteroidota bacterium]